MTERMYDLQELQRYIEDKLSISVRTTVLGFIQRRRNLSAFDRGLASKMGVVARELLINGHSGQAVEMKENKMIHQEFATINIEMADKQGQYRLLKAFLCQGEVEM
jgi:6-phosphofructokinase 1